MQATEKLYFTDSSLLDFTATVTDIKQTARGYEVALNHTAFYPTGGGQPNDTGLLDDINVVDVIEDDAGLIRHVVENPEPLRAGQTVQGRVDRQRRLEPSVLRPGSSRPCLPRRGCLSHSRGLVRLRVGPP